MRVLGIETTCDETSCAVVEDGTLIHSNIIASQMALHSNFGGVVPELASRKHIEIVDKVLQMALETANMTIADIDLISVAKGPGLIGALLVGMNFAKGLSFATGKPLIGINHIEAHLYAAMMSVETIQESFPALGLILSGGHTSIVLIKDIGTYELLSETADDAIGEAFDKVARMLELPYPGGPEIERLAETGNPKVYPFRKSRIKDRPLDFSFSGIKTSVLYTVRDIKKAHGTLTEEHKKDLAACFQEAVFDDIVSKTKMVLQQHPVKAIFLGGGVTRNKRLRALMEASASLPVFWPKDDLCVDNAAMLAGLAFHKHKKQAISELLTLEPETRMPF